MTSSTSLRSALCAAAVLLFAAGCASLNPMKPSKPSVDPDVVALIEDHAVSVSEFERRYNRSVGNWEASAQDSMPAYRDFLERYVNFRLKVRAARDAGYEDKPEVQQEMADYRENFARPYMIEEKVTRPLARDLYEKQQEQVDVSHILLRVPPDAPPADTLEAYREMQSLVDSLDQGVDFGDLALRHSEDPSASRNPNAKGYRGRLGFMPAGRVVKPFEDAAYATPVGERSDIIRTQFGYHVLKVSDRRPTPPQIRVAHIMLRPNKPTLSQGGASAGSSGPSIEQLQDSLDAGVPFAELARRYSVDKRSARNGGDLGSYFGPTVRLPKPFKDAAFALDDVGDVSDVVHSRAGAHLIKLLGRRENRSFEDAYPDLKKRLKKLPRTKKAKADLAQHVRREQDARIDSALVRRALGDAPADSVYSRLANRRFDVGVAAADTVARLGETGYTLGAFSDFVQKQRRFRGKGMDAAFSLLDQFLNEQALTDATQTLEEHDPQFGALMREFRDGILLFQFMEDSVWTKAQQDTAALRAYYQGRQDQYRFPQRDRAIGLISASDSVLAATADQLDAGRSLDTVIGDLQADSTGPYVRVDTVMVTDSTTAEPYSKVRQIREGEHLSVQPYGDRRSVLIVHDGQLTPRRMRFEEAIPELSNDYQTVLEDRLIERLRRRYEVYTYPEHLTSAFQGPQPDNFVEQSASSVSSSR